MARAIESLTPSNMVSSVAVVVIGFSSLVYGLVTGSSGRLRFTSDGAGRSRVRVRSHRWCERAVSHAEERARGLEFDDGWDRVGVGEKLRIEVVG